MTTRAQHSANRRNAAKSTGPKTHRGKAKSSGNARSHGLTAPVPMADIQKYLNILNGPTFSGATSEVTLEATAPATLRLAEAEAHLQRCRVAERAHQDLMFERAMDGADPWRTNLDERFKRDPLDIEVGKIFLEHSEEADDSFFKGALRVLIRSSEGRPVRLHSRANTLLRYRREAEAKRRKALHEWLNSNNPETKPISI